MKRKHQYQLSSALILGGVISLAFFPVGCQTVQPKAVEGDAVVFEGTVAAMAPDQGIVSGGIAVYRLVRYKVDKVCQGEYGKGEIVVDHLILTGKELESVSVNSRVCVSVKRSNKIFTRFDADGIRSAADEVKEFFIAGDAPRAGTSCCDVK